MQVPYTQCITDLMHYTMDDLDDLDDLAAY